MRSPSDDAPGTDDPRHDVVREATRLDDRIDDLTRARVWGALEAALEDEPARQRRATRGRRVRWAVAVAAVAVAALALAAISMARRTVSRGSTIPAVAQILEVPAGATARAQLSPAAAVTLQGASRLAIDRTDRVVDVNLERGALAGDYDHTRGGTMYIRTPHAVIHVVGTVFAVEVEAEATCVSVARGVVEVQPLDRGALARRVQDGEAWCTDAARPRTITPEAERWMSAHDSAIATAAARSPAVTTATTATTGVTAPATAAATPSSSSVATPGPPLPPPRSRAGAPGLRPVSPPLPPVGPSLPPATAASELAPSAPASSEPSLEPSPPSPPPRRPAALDVELYSQAERALRVGDTSLADELLARLVVNHPDSDLVDDALFERARLAYAREAWGAAQSSLDQLLGLGATPLRGSARALVCRIAERTGDRDAARCFDQLRHEEMP